jgi:hypothetical protein
VAGSSPKRAGLVLATLIGVAELALLDRYHAEDA